MLKVKPKPYEKIQSLVRRFRKLCEKEGVMREMKKRQAYEKPSETKRRKMKKSHKKSQSLQS